MIEILTKEQLPDEITSLSAPRDWPGNFTADIEEGNIIIRIDRYWNTNIQTQCHVPIYPSGYLDAYWVKDRDQGAKLLLEDKNKFLEECNNREVLLAKEIFDACCKTFLDVQCVKDLKEQIGLSEPYEDEEYIWVDLEIEIPRYDCKKLLLSIQVIKEFIDIFSC